MKTIRGDLLKMALNGDFDVIVHGCNCKCIMGAGIAAGVAKIFPHAYEVDKNHVGPKLGYFSAAQIWVMDGQVVKGQRHGDKMAKSLIVVNAYTQFMPGRDLRPWAMAKVMARISKVFHDVRIGIPQIGCGIAGGNWEDEIHPFIEEVFDEVDLTVVEYDPTA